MGDTKEGEDNLRKQLAAAVRSIQWSYAIYWTTSSKQPGVLQWGEGYYNGDIKTRRTVQSTDLEGDDDQIGSQRSDQLKELYESLSSSNNNKQSRRPLAALSPEDLTHVEWFYLVCMSFVFNIGQGLPGTSFANGRTIWLCNVHAADTSIFSRSLLAKSAGIKTIVCFPFQSGVLEFGVTGVVPKHLGLIQHLRASLLENSCPSLPGRSSFLAQSGSDDTLHDPLPPLVQQGEEVSPSDGSNEAEPVDLSLTDELLFKGRNDKLSPAQSWYVLEDGLSNCVHSSMSTSDCISQSMAHLSPSPKTEVAMFDETREWNNNQGKVDSVLGSSQISQDLHFQNVLSSIFKTSNQEMLGLSSQSLQKKSCFIRWKNGGKQDSKSGDQVTSTPQSMLKKVLFQVPLMHRTHSNDPIKEDSAMKNCELRKQEVDVSSTNHVIAERRRRVKVNERFSTLRSLIPSTTKVDKISILDGTISYLKELERRVEESESSRELGSYAMKEKKRKAVDIEERTSDNYGSGINVGDENAMKASGNEGEQLVCTREGLIDNTVLVRLVDKEIMINIRCPLREGLLLQIMGTMSSLKLESQSVQSSTIDGNLSLTMHTRVKGSNDVSVGVITQALQKVITNC